MLKLLSVSPYVMAGVAILLIAITALWYSDRHSQYQLGVSETRLAVERQTELIRKMKNDEASRAADAALNAANRVCINAGIDVRECSGL